MRKILLSIGVAFLGLILVVLISYGLTSFVLYESNPELWSEGVRMQMVFWVLAYVCFAPLIIYSVKSSL